MDASDSAENCSIAVAENIPDDKKTSINCTAETDFSTDVAGNDRETLTLEPESVQQTEMINHSEESDADATDVVGSEKKWPGWPGDCVFRLVVAVDKVGSIIGRKGEVVKRICEETKARIRIIDGAFGTSDRIVLISGREEIKAILSPAMDALLRVFKLVSGLSESENDANDSKPAGAELCSIRLLVSSGQALSLIGKQGTVIKSIQETTGVSMRVLSGDEAPVYAAADERIVVLQGDTLKVLEALEAVMGHLRKFLVDHSVLPLYENTYKATVSKDHRADAWSDQSSLNSASQAGLVSEYSLSGKRESLLNNRDIHLELRHQSSGASLDLATSGIRSSGLGRVGASIVTQITQTMQIPLSYAEDIIGVGGSNIAFIRRTSGAILTIEESRELPNEITVEIKGSTSQVQLARQLIQEAMSQDRNPITSSYGRMDYGLRSSYSDVGSSYLSSLSSQSHHDHRYSGYVGRLHQF